jgi:hypothetical protein
MIGFRSKVEDAKSNLTKEGREDFDFSVQETVIAWPSSSLKLGKISCFSWNYSISIWD